MSTRTRTHIRRTKANHYVGFNHLTTTPGEKNANKHTLDVRRKHHGDIKQLLSVPLVGTDLQTERASHLAVNRLIVTSVCITSKMKWQP